MTDFVPYFLVDFHFQAADQISRSLFVERGEEIYEALGGSLLEEGYAGNYIGGNERWFTRDDSFRPIQD